MAAFGKIGEFNVNSDTWAFYVERLEQFFIVNGVKEEMKVPTLITAMGGEAYELLVNLCTPSKPAEKAYIELVDIMKRHLNPRPSILAERYIFRLRGQGEAESLAEYVAALKKLTRFCEFSSGLQDSLRDQFVCGIKSDDIRQRLFAERARL